MPYPYAELQESTQALIKTYNGQASRFKPLEYHALLKKIIGEGEKGIGGMRYTYKNYVQQKPVENPSENIDYLKAIDSIVYLAKQLPKVSPQTPECCQQQNILLGALYYRYSLVSEFYTKNFFGQLFSWWKVIDIKKTALFNTLEEMLGISKDNQLDSLSISMCCRAYIEYLNQIDDCKNTAYIPVPERIVFFGKLRNLINLCESERSSAAMLVEIKYLEVIQHVDALLCETHAQLYKVLPSFFISLQKKLNTQKAQKNTLSRAQIVDCVLTLDSLPSTFMKNLIDYLLPEGVTLKTEDFSEFKQAINRDFDQFKKSTLLGMYVITLTEAKSKNLLHINTILTSVVGDMRMGEEEDALIFLDYFLEQSRAEIPASILNPTWGSFSNLKQTLAKEITEVVPNPTENLDSLSVSP